jgi:hypothetical protein
MLKITLSFRHGYKIAYKGENKESEAKPEPKSSVYLGDFECFCKFYGKLKMDIRGATSYYSIEHFKRSGLGWSDHNSQYLHCHYIGDKFKLGIPW